MNLQPSTLSWLLAPEDPPIRHAALVDLLGRPPGDPEVRQARQMIPDYAPVAGLLARQKPGGYWAGPDYYIPKHTSTFWVLSILGDLGHLHPPAAFAGAVLTADARVQRACEFMFGHQREDGAFCRRRYVPGKGRVWERDAEPCTQARIVRFLIQFGCGEDPRTARGFDWLLSHQRGDAMWLCGWARGRGCLRATLDFLAAATIYPALARDPATLAAADVVCDLLMAPGMGRYHVADEWRTLAYPYFGYGVISALDTLLRLGYSPEHPKMAAALSYLLSRRLPDGRWPLDREAIRPPFSFGQAGAANKWLTLDALRVLNL